MGKPFFCAGNWKMHHAPEASREFVRAFRGYLTHDVEEWVRRGTLEMAIIPPYISVVPFAEAGRDLPLAVGAQNCHEEQAGAFTGEVSATMLAELGCAYVIIGHSERRHIFGEQDAIMPKKIRAVLSAGMVPIFCVGELLKERNDGDTLAVLKRQMQAVLPHLEPRELEHRFVVAYEPVWAIGTGKVAQESDAQDACHYLRQLIASQGGNDAGTQVRILYGGSVKPENASALAHQPDIDGFLVGGASLKAESFLNIVRASQASSSL